MHVVFINFEEFRGNSGVHIHPIANEFVRHGDKVTVFIPGNRITTSTYGDDFLYEIRLFSDKRRLSHQGDLVFIAWTPRELVRKKTMDLVSEYAAPYFVHLEDNEEKLISDYLGRSFEELIDMDYEDLDKIVPEGLSHPLNYRKFINDAAGASCIISTLEKFVPKKVPAVTFWPACEEAIFKIEEEDKIIQRKKLGVKDSETIIFYPGNMHKSNAREISNLYSAVRLLNEKGKRVTLLRVGQNHAKFSYDIDLKEKYYRELGERSLNENIDYISAADILVQPGADNSFNKYRFPSKLPLFLASGRPVILADSHIGKYLDDWKNCLKFVHGDAQELAHKISLLIDFPKLVSLLGANGRHFAVDNFNWEKSALILKNFIKRLFILEME